MRVSSVTYRRLCNTGNYENVAVEATVELADGEEAGRAVQLARETVHAGLAAQLAVQLERYDHWPRALGEDPRPKRAVGAVDDAP